MPIYLYNYVDGLGKPTGEQVEIFQSMKEDSLEIHPENKKRICRTICSPRIIIDSKKPKTVGDLLDKNTEKMEKEGKIKKKPKSKPVWQTGKKPLSVSGWTAKQKEKYVWEGRKP